MENTKESTKRKGGMSLIDELFQHISERRKEIRILLMTFLVEKMLTQDTGAGTVKMERTVLPGETLKELQFRVSKYSGSIQIFHPH